MPQRCAAELRYNDILARYYKEAFRVCHAYLHVLSLRRVTARPLRREVVCVWEGASVHRLLRRRSAAAQRLPPTNTHASESVHGQVHLLHAFS